MIRAPVKPPEKSPAEASEDRQFRSAPASTGTAAPAQAVAVAVPAAVVAVPPPRPVTPQLQDAQSRVDGCDVPIADTDATSDEDLPAAEGGVA